MAVAKVSLPCFAGGRTVITLNLCGQRSGSNADRAQFRIVRRISGQADVALMGTPDFVLTAQRDVRSWTFIDNSVPTTATYEYVLQINRQDGGGTFYEMVLLAQHFKR